MATTKIKQLESFDSGSNYNFQDKMLDKTSARSMFDLSHRRIGTMAENGVIMPIGLIPTIPNDSYEISADILLRALPTVIPLESRQRLYIYAFYNRMGDLWNNFETFMKKGYSGNVIKKIPILTHMKNTLEINQGTTLMKARNNLTRNTTWEVENAIQATSMGESLGLPHGYHYTSKTVDESTVYGYENTANQNKFIAKEDENYREEISALPFMMLLRIWRDYFTNKNYWIDDRVILPDDDQEFRLNDDGELISAKNANKLMIFDISSKVRDMKKGSYASYNDNGSWYYFGLPYHEYPKDYFTSALPFMQRGDAATLEKNLNIQNAEGKVHLYASDGTLKAEQEGYLTNSTTPMPGLLFGTTTGGQTTNTLIGFGNPSTSFAEGDYLAVGTGGTASVKIEITMNDLRKLAIEQSELEALARTDGSYAEFGLTFFNKVSKNALDHKPVYIGGMYKEIRYTEVVQTSESNNTPMGSYTGHSTSTLNGNIGTIDCDDYGYIMILACIMPDVIYAENLEKHWTNLLQSQMYLPPRAKLGMTNILKKEARFNYAITEQAEAENNSLFAYQNIFDEMRYKPNEIHGLMADMWNKSYAPYTQSRIIADTPVWSRDFALASSDNIRNDYLVAPEETPFTYDLGLHIKAVRPIPYRPIPANLTGL